MREGITRNAKRAARRMVQETHQIPRMLQILEITQPVASEPPEDKTASGCRSLDEDSQWRFVNVLKASISMDMTTTAIRDLSSGRL